MNPSSLISLVAIGLSWLVSVPAHAQPLFGRAESIESTVLNADIVVVGKLVTFGGEPVDETGRRPATIAVAETLKGEHGERLSLQLLHSVSVLTKWKQDAGLLLVAVQGDGPTGTRVIDLADKELAVLTADFTLLRKPEDVLRSARETILRLPGVKRIDTFRLQVPAATVAGTKWQTYYQTGGYITLTVPVDERLEKRAREYIGSQSYRQREEGAQALRYFRSDENIARVKALLNDPGWAYLKRAEENNGVEVRVYGIRQAAYDTLNYWGVKAKMPMIRETILKLKGVQIQR
jgi:hypothetical protein